jgi:zinc transporter ZupT
MKNLKYLITGGLAGLIGMMLMELNTPHHVLDFLMGVAVGTCLVYVIDSLRK